MVLGSGTIFYLDYARVGNPGTKVHTLPSKPLKASKDVFSRVGIVLQVLYGVEPKTKKPDDGAYCRGPKLVYKFLRVW